GLFDGAAQGSESGEKNRGSGDVISYPAHPALDLVIITRGQDEVIGSLFCSSFHNERERIAFHIAASGNAVVGNRYLAANHRDKAGFEGFAYKPVNRRRTGNREKDKAIDAGVLTKLCKFGGHVRHIGARLLVIVKQREIGSFP